jgi:anti-sigma-K factor RskA
MSDQEDVEALAGEYVLGTLDGAERAAVAARRAREPALDAAILAWERRLAPLDESALVVEPPENLFARIKAEIEGGQRPARTEVIDLSRSLRRWRAAALASGAVAAALAVGLLWQNILQNNRPPEASNFVAVLQKDAVSPAFLVEVDLNSRVLTVRRVAAEGQPDKSYELWMIHDKLGTPKSMGVIADQGFTVRGALSGYDPSVVETAVYAITLEPRGGSPTGQPTSAPLWAGKMIRATP